MIPNVDRRLPIEQILHLALNHNPLIGSKRITEIVAVISNLLYTFFYLRQNPICFVFGLISPILFLLITFRVKLYADVLLQVFYFVITIYGIWQWGGEWKNIHISLESHLIYVIGGIITTIVLGYVLKKRTDAKMPFADSFATTFAIIGTWLMMNFVHENWLYFIVINTLSIYLFANRKLYWSACMFVIYLLMSIDGYWQMGWFTA